MVFLFEIDFFLTNGRFGAVSGKLPPVIGLVLYLLG